MPRLDPEIAALARELRRDHPDLTKADALRAATAMMTMLNAFADRWDLDQALEIADRYIYAEEWDADVAAGVKVLVA